MRRLDLLPRDDVCHRRDGAATHDVVSAPVGGEADAAFRHRPDDGDGSALPSGTAFRSVAKMAGTPAGPDVGLQLRRGGVPGIVPGPCGSQAVYLLSVL